MSITLESLGFTKEELQQRVIDQLCRQVLTGTACDDEGNPVETDSDFSRKLEALVKTRIDETIAAIADKHVLPNVADYIIKLTLQETNKWGEQRGTKVSFIEYLVQRCEAYMTEPVDYQGKPKGTDSYSWTAKSTRVAHMIHEHLHYEIERAMKKALGEVNSSVAKGLNEATRIAINDVASKLTVSVKTSN